MFERKTSTRTTRKGSKIVTDTDGVQKSISVYLSGNNLDIADFRISTDRWTSMVWMFRGRGGQLVCKASALRYCETKDQIIRRFIRTAEAAA